MDKRIKGNMETIDRSEQLENSPLPLAIISLLFENNKKTASMNSEWDSIH